jgi:hypothetical protein
LATTVLYSKRKGDGNNCFIFQEKGRWQQLFYIPREREVATLVCNRRGRWQQLFVLEEGGGNNCLYWKREVATIVCIGRGRWQHLETTCE